MHATHTVHAVPDLRLAAGRLRDDFNDGLLFFARADLSVTSFAEQAGNRTP